MNRLELLVTTFCDRKCPECCYRIPKHETLAAEHYGWDVFERAAEAFYGVESLYVSGGEATLHPDFDCIAREFKKLFGAKIMILVSNGAKVAEHMGAMSYFDYYWITQFGSESDRAATKLLIDLYGPKVLLASSYHTPLGKPGGGRPCPRYGFPACAGGRAWPCCVGPGIPGAKSVAVAKGCETELLALGAPCGSCAFSL